MRLKPGFEIPYPEFLINPRFKLKSEVKVYIFNISTFSGGTSLGGISLWKTMTIGGTSKINIEGTWKNAIPYVKIGGTRKPEISYIKSNSNWKRAQI